MSRVARCRFVPRRHAATPGGASFRRKPGDLPDVFAMPDLRMTRDCPITSQQIRLGTRRHEAQQGRHDLPLTPRPSTELMRPLRLAGSTPVDPPATGPRLGGPLRPTQAAAVADFCADRRNTSSRRAPTG